MSQDIGHADYRDSHASTDYGELYRKTYETGYYHYQWERIEKPLLEGVMTDLYASGKRRCLDFACGTGRITGVLEGIFPSVTGVDVSATMLEQARESCSKAEFIQRDITREPLNESFDVATAFRFFLNAQPALRSSALDAIASVLDAEGRLVMNIHVNRTSILGFIYRLRNRLKGRVVANTCGYEEIERCLQDAGFEIESVYWYSYLPRTGWRMSGVARVMMMPVEKFCRWFPLIPERLAQSFLIVARKR